MEADLAQKQVLLPVPKACPSGDCRSTTFHHIIEGSEHTDYQEIRVQEQAQELSMGSLPQSITAILTDDLADSCRPGGNSPLLKCDQMWHFAIWRLRAPQSLEFLTHVTILLFKVEVF